MNRDLDTTRLPEPVKRYFREVATMQPPADLMDDVIEQIERTSPRRTTMSAYFLPVAAALLVAAVIGGGAWAMSPAGPFGAGVAPDRASPSALPAPPTGAPSPDPEALPSVGEIEREVRIGPAYPLRAIGHGSLWMYEWPLGYVNRFDPETGDLQAQVETGEHPNADHRDAAILVTEEVVYAAASDERVVAIDPDTNAVTDFVEGVRASSLAIADDMLWATDYHHDEVVWFDLTTGEELGRIGIPGNPIALVVEPGTAWVVGADGTLAQIEIATRRRVATYDIEAGASTLVMRGDSLYISGESRAAERFDLILRAVVATGANLDHVVSVDDRLVGVDRNGHVAILDPETLAWTGVLEIGAFDRAAVMVDGDALWVDALREPRVALRVLVSD